MGLLHGMATFYKDSRQVYRILEWDRLEWLNHGFGTRAAGDWVERNLVTLRQMHSDVCLRVERLPSERPVGDALASGTGDLFLAVRTADCLPILMVDPRHRAVAAVHGGWRGTAAAVAVKAVRFLASEFGSRPEEIQVAIGPGICGRCYEVGPEVARRFAAWLPGLAEASEPTKLDLVEVNRRQLLGAGVRAEGLHLGARCTACFPEEFYSYRRQGARAGRVLSGIGIRPR